MSAAVIILPTAAAGPRRRLAENVVCLFDEDRPPVWNRPHPCRGTLPRGVSRLPRHDYERRLPVGSRCWMPTGVVVEVVRWAARYQADGHSVFVRSLGEPLTIYDIATSQSKGTATEAWTKPERLRRVHHAYLGGGMP